VSERPTVLKTELRQDRHVLHAGDGPAMAFADGYSIWAWHGVLVPQEVIETPHALKPAEITKQPNAEVRRIMLERFGAERYLRESGAKVLDSSDYGTLFRADLPGDEPVVMVEVENSTAEPDGSFKKYMIRVPPTIERAREAVAWSFAVPEADYKPAFQS
jgi:hypothetical protein